MAGGPLTHAARRDALPGRRDALPGRHDALLGRHDALPRRHGSLLGRCGSLLEALCCCAWGRSLRARHVNLTAPRRTQLSLIQRLQQAMAGPSLMVLGRRGLEEVVLLGAHSCLCFGSACCCHLLHLLGQRTGHQTKLQPRHLCLCLFHAYRLHCHACFGCGGCPSCCCHETVEAPTPSTYEVEALVCPCLRWSCEDALTWLSYFTNR